MQTRQAELRPGFSLMEIMAALVILGLIVGFVGVNFFGQSEKAKRGAAKIDMKTMQKAIEIYEGDMNELPTKLDDLVKKPSGKEGEWQKGGYLSKRKTIPKDPWGKSYIYKVTQGQENPYELYSKGGKDTDKERKKISVWDEK